MQRYVFDPWFFVQEEYLDRGTCRKRLQSRYALGLFFIFLVAIIWTAASVCAQWLYTEDDFDSPFLMTYIGICLFAFLLPLKSCTDRLGITNDSCAMAPTEAFDLPAVKDMEDEDDVTMSSTGGTIISGIKQAASTDWSAHTADMMRTTMRPGGHWDRCKHFFAALHIAPVMFIANWLFNASLASTSVASATVLVSTSNVFVFIMAVLTGDELFNAIKLSGVLLGIVGTCLTGWHDLQNHDDTDAADAAAAMALAAATDSDVDGDFCSGNGCEYVLWGDTLSVLAAVAFAGYAVQVRLLCPQDEDLYSMQLLLGYIGVIIMIPLLPLAAALWFEIGVSAEVFWLCALKGLLDFVFSEYLHFRAVILTTATTATVGLSLNIPMAFFADWIMGKSNILSAASLFGATLVTAGFLVVNFGSSDEIEETEDANDTEPPVYELQQEPQDRVGMSSGRLV